MSFKIRARLTILTEYYFIVYETPLEQNLEEGSGNFKRLLATLCNVNRDESGYTDIISARADATELFLAGKAKFNTDESTFNRIVCQRNYEQLKVIFQEYRNIAGHSLERAIKKECSADVEIGLKAILRCIDSKAEFFALQLNKNISALGGDDSQVIRILINRCEIDLEEIKESYERMFGKSLESLIEV